MVISRIFEYFDNLSDEKKHRWQEIGKIIISIGLQPNLINRNVQEFFINSPMFEVNSIYTMVRMKRQGGIKIKLMNASYHKITMTEGMIDLRSRYDKKLLIKSGMLANFNTGLYMMIPEGYYLSIVLVDKLIYKGIVNRTPILRKGDSSEIMVLVHNMSGEDIIVEEGEEIANGILQKYDGIYPEIVKKLNEDNS